MYWASHFLFFFEPRGGTSNFTPPLHLGEFSMAFGDGFD